MVAAGDDDHCRQDRAAAWCWYLRLVKVWMTRPCQSWWIWQQEGLHTTWREASCWIFGCEIGCNALDGVGTKSVFVFERFYDLVSTLLPPIVCCWAISTVAWCWFLSCMARARHNPSEQPKDFVSFLLTPIATSVTVDCMKSPLRSPVNDECGNSSWDALHVAYCMTFMVWFRSMKLKIYWKDLFLPKSVTTPCKSFLTFIAEMSQRATTKAFSTSKQEQKPLFQQAIGKSRFKQKYLYLTKTRC